MLKHYDTVYVSETAESYSYDDIATESWDLVFGTNPEDNKLFCNHTAEAWASLWHICFEESSLG